MTDRKQPLLIVSSSVEDGSDVLRSYRFDSEGGGLEPLAGQSEGVSSSVYAAADPTGRYLYVTDHVGKVDGKSGAVAAYALDRASGGMTLLNRQSAMGDVPCYVSVTGDGKHAFVANYGSGTVAMYPVAEDGSLGAASDVKTHGEGSEKQARAHSIVLDKANRFVVAADLGVDRIYSYRVDKQAGKLVPNDRSFVETAAGAGPRHLVFHPNGRLLYAMTEYDNTVIAMHYTPDSGAIEIFQVESSLPAGYAGKTYGSDIHIHPNGRFLYAANRGHDSLVLFTIDPQRGSLTFVGHEPTNGSFPRSFAIDPSGKYLLVGNEKANEIRTFAIDKGTGELTPSGKVVSVPKPAGLMFV